MESLLWPCLHQNIFQNSIHEPKIINTQLQSLSALLEQQYPSIKLSVIFERTSTADLFDFLCKEPLHYYAIQTAWNILGNRLLNTPAPIPEHLYSCFMDNSEGMRIKNRLVALKDFSGTAHPLFLRNCELVLQQHFFITIPGRLLSLKGRFRKKWKKSRQRAMTGFKHCHQLKNKIFRLFYGHTYRWSLY